MRESLSTLLARIFFVQPAFGTKAGGPLQGGTSEKPTLAENVVELPAGALVEVRFKTKEKLRGRIGERSNDSFELQVASGDKSTVVTDGQEGKLYDDIIGGNFFLRQAQGDPSAAPMDFVYIAREGRKFFRVTQPLP